MYAIWERSRWIAALLSSAFMVPPELIIMDYTFTLNIDRSSHIHYKHDSHHWVRDSWQENHNFTISSSSQALCSCSTNGVLARMCCCISRQAILGLLHRSHIQRKLWVVLGSSLMMVISDWDFHLVTIILILARLVLTGMYNPNLRFRTSNLITSPRISLCFYPV